MKKKNLLLSAMLFFSTLSISLFASCDKDTNCYLDVKVVEESVVDPISGTAISGVTVPGATVEVYQDGGNVHANGITNGSGIYSTYFDAPAIVKIKAKEQVYNATGQAIGERRGETAVRLKQGETVSALITLGSQLY